MFHLKRAIQILVVAFVFTTALVFLPVSQADYTYNGVHYYNPFFSGGPPLPNGSPNLPPGYHGAYNPFIDQPPGVTIINSGFGYPVVVTSGSIIQSDQGRRPCKNYDDNNNNYTYIPPQKTPRTVGNKVRYR